MTKGQQQAIEQLREIEKASQGSFEIVSIKGFRVDNGSVKIEISFSCEDIVKEQLGLPLKDRERFVLEIPPLFPFECPQVTTPHHRFAGFPHVQWENRLCLYQSPSTEWDPGDGMFGYIDRLNLWLRAGARNELDPWGGPLHPPVTYFLEGPVRTVVVRANTPEVKTDNWFGLAYLRSVSKNRVDVYDWADFAGANNQNEVAAAVLLAEPMPFEFPSTVAELFDALAKRGMSKDLLILLLQVFSGRNDDSSPLYLIIGTPMRGTRGSGVLLQHLTAWFIEKEQVQTLNLAFEKYSDDERLQKIGKRCEEIFLNWAKTARVAWCRVEEERPEIIVKRDYTSPLNWFSSKVVSLWGCGALGSHVAEMLIRIGVKRLILRDCTRVKPGVITRQLYEDLDIGYAKAFMLANRLRRIRPETVIESYSENVLVSPLEETWTDRADIILDTTAAGSVFSKLELARQNEKIQRVPIVSMVVGHRAENCMAVIAGKDYSGGPSDVSRKAKIEACQNSGLRLYLDEFWPSGKMRQQRIFQPEPGCSENTFVGSEADMQVLAGVMLNQVADHLNRITDRSASCFFFTQPHVAGNGLINHQSIFWSTPDMVIKDEMEGYEIRLSEFSLKEILKCIRNSQETSGKGFETGGLLFGQRDDATRIIWVSEITGPPEDSHSSAVEFVCGVKGTSRMNVDKKQRTLGSIQYIGMWHTHPSGSQNFSLKDFNAMQRLANDSLESPRYVLLVIIGTPETIPQIGAYVFSRAKLRESIIPTTKIP